MIIPQPLRVLDGCSGSFQITEATGIVCSDASLEPVAELLREGLRIHCGLQFATSAAGTRHIRLETTGYDPDLEKLPATGGVRADGADANGERYLLTIDSDQILIRAQTPEGVYRAITSVLQLADENGVVPAVTVLDAPRFAWRGLSLDTSRTFWSVQEVKRILDLLALYKFNVLHFHLTDSEGWRLELTSRPELTEIGSSGAAGDRPGGFYTQSEYRELLDYAEQRHVTIVPEIDMPGHAVSILKAIPVLAGDGSANSRDEMLQRPGITQFLHPDNPHLPAFLTDVLTEVASLHSGSNWLHIGGDEPFGMPDHLYQQFMQLVQPIARDTGKQLVGWQEMARAEVSSADLVQFWLQFDPTQFEGAETMLNDSGGVTLPDGTTIPAEVLGTILENVQRASGDVALAREQGARIIVSRSTHAYLDTQYQEPSHDASQEADRIRLGMPYYPKSTIEGFLNWDPASVHELIDESAIAGVEAAIWCESIQNFEDLCFLLLPRLPGIAERAWSPQTPFAWNDYRGRLSRHSRFWRNAELNWFRSSLVKWS